MPLSADVGIVQGEGSLWIFDVGSSDETATAINALPGKKIVVLSHFHADHAANLPKIQFERLYAGSYTCKKLGMGIPVEREMTFFDGVELRLFPLPSSHAKGCVGLEVGGAFAFVGDGLYSGGKDGSTYNVSVLHETIAAVRRLSAKELLVSHDAAFVRPADEMLAHLEMIYARRKPGEAFLSV